MRFESENSDGEVDDGTRTQYTDDMDWVERCDRLMSTNVKRETQTGGSVPTYLPGSMRV